MADEIHVGDTPLLQYTVYDGDDRVNLDDEPPDTMEMRLTAPATGTSATVSAVRPTGTTYDVAYQTATTTFDAAGKWQVSVRITWGARRFEAELDQFEVHESKFP